MIRILSLLFVISLCVAPLHSIWADSSALVESAHVTSQTLHVDTRLPSHKHFETVVLDALKSGQKLDVIYTVYLVSPHWLWSGTQDAEKRFRRAEYNHRTDEFTLSEKEVNQYISDEHALMQNLLDVPEVSFNLPHKAQLPLHVRVTVRFRPYEGEKKGLLNWLALNRLWQKRQLTEEAALNVQY